MTAVPHDLRDGAYALGSTSYRCRRGSWYRRRSRGSSRRTSSHLTRVGETMIVLIAMGQQPNLDLRPSPGQTMTAFIGATALGDADRAPSSTRRSSRSGLTLFVMTLVMNIVSIRLVRRYREVYE